MRYALYDGAGFGEFYNCQFEGAYSANVWLEEGKSLFSACRFFAAGNGINVMIRATEIAMKDCVLSEALAGAAACKGIVLGQSGDWVAACDIDVFARSQEAGVVDFTNSSEANSVRVRGYNPDGVLYVGTPDESDDVDIFVSGGGGGLLTQSPTI